MATHNIRLQARFDQINASHRDALESARRASWGLFQLSEEERQKVIDGIMPYQRELLQTLAEELGDHALLKALDAGDSQ